MKREKGDKSMRKTAAIITASLLLQCCPAMAVSGDIAGTYYSTNISAIVNGREIDSINIGGRTLISAEAMEQYGFGVYWEENERALYITHIVGAEIGETPVIKKSNYPSGMPLGNYYETDIKTYLDDHIITAYNIGGKTYIPAREMEAYGYEVIWNEIDRNVFITSPDRAGSVPYAS